MRARRPKNGWLMTLRRFAVLGALAFGVVFVVGVARSEALAFAAGDEFCVAMGGTLPMRSMPADPLDLSDPSHACCDVGLCLVATAAPPLAPPAIAAAPRATVLLPPPAQPYLAVATASPLETRSRSPPAD